MRLNRFVGVRFVFYRKEKAEFVFFVTNHFRLPSLKVISQYDSMMHYDILLKRCHLHF